MFFAGTVQILREMCKRYSYSHVIANRFLILVILLISALDVKHLAWKLNNILKIICQRFNSKFATTKYNVEGYVHELHSDCNA